MQHFRANTSKKKVPWANIENIGILILDVDCGELPISFMGNDVYFYMSESIIPVGGSTPKLVARYVGAFNITPEDIHNVTIVKIQDDVITYIDKNDIPDIRKLTLASYRFRNDDTRIEFLSLRDRLF